MIRAGADRVRGTADRIEGSFKRVAGVAGKALKLDGYTAAVVRDPQACLYHKEGFPALPFRTDK